MFEYEVDNLTLIPNPAYPYVQYNDDDNISAFFIAYNVYSQNYLNLFNTTTLPIYYNQEGNLLNFCGLGIYGIQRQDLSIGYPRAIGPLNTFNLNQEAPNELKVIANSQSFAVSDLIYQRIIQWNIFKGDGKIFTLRWLKRRCIRFLSGDIFPDDTYQISVSFTGATAVLIMISEGSVPLTLVNYLIAGIEGGVLELPFQYNYVVEMA